MVSSEEGQGLEISMVTVIDRLMVSIEVGLDLEKTIGAHRVFDEQWKPVMKEVG